MVLVGRVATGSGDLKRWMTLYADAYATAVGAPLYPGSLNVVLEEPWLLPPDRLSVPAEAVGRLIHLVLCLVGARRCFILRTDMADRAGGGEHRILEIVSDVRLRDDLGVNDGDLMEVVVGDPVESQGGGGRRCRP
ncbi:MAG: CTP-dependent riboflavin kinase [Actinomycetota bacterium]|nr:CTP-dependent riboflavin kinase [Actinomycetota bacterium]